MDKTLVDDESDKKSLEISVAVEKEAKSDELSNAIGDLGTWQVILITILAVPSQMSAGWNLLAIIFLAPKTKYICLSRANNSQEILNGTCYDDCEQYEYITEFKDSIITQFGLICEKAWLANLAQTMFMFGVLVGSMVFGFVADRYGRRKGLLLASMMHLILGVLLPLCPEYWSFTIIRFLLGTSTAGLMVVAFVIAIEIIGPNRREMVSSVYHIPFLVGEIIMPVIAYYFRSWRTFSLSIGLPNLLFLIYIFWLPESPRWLISVGRLEEATKIMEKAARRNNLPTNNIPEIVHTLAKETKANDKSNHTGVSYVDLITNPSLRIRNLFSCVSWFILGLSFYGGMQYIGQTSTNVFISIGLAGAMQIPGILGSGYLAKLFGRRFVIIGFLLINSVCSGLLMLPDSWLYLKIVIGAVSVTSAVGAFNIMYVFTSELFPTVARNMAMGVSSTMSRVGSMLAPFVAGMSQGAWIPPVIFAVAPLVAAVVTWCLPETKGKKLANRLDDDQ